VTREADATTRSVRVRAADATSDLLVGIRNATYRTLALPPLLRLSLPLLPREQLSFSGIHCKPKRLSFCRPS